jgi:nitrite reductase (NO-forming)
MNHNTRRCQPRPRRPGDLRPTDIVGAFFVCGIAFLSAGLIVAIADARIGSPDGRWLALHLVFVGGVSQLILGASQFFAGAYLATDPPPRRLIRLELGSWNLGTVLLAIAVPASWAGLAWAAVGLLFVSLALYAAGVTAMRRRSLRRAPWATRWYLAGVSFFALGIAAGLTMALAIVWPHGNLLAAHMALNLAGWFGAAIVGTLHTFYPSLTQTELRFPRLQGPTWLSWLVGVASLAVGYAFAVESLSVAGWVALFASAILLMCNVVGSMLAARRPFTLPARVVGLGQAFLLAGLAFATASAVSDGSAHVMYGSNRAITATLLVAGWIGLTVLGSLLHLLAVVVRVRSFSRPLPAPRPRPDLAVTAVAGAGIVGLALAQPIDLDVVTALALAALLGGYGLLVARVAKLGLQVARHARPHV